MFCPKIAKNLKLAKYLINHASYLIGVIVDASDYSDGCSHNCAERSFNNPINNAGKNVKLSKVDENIP
ncbi:MAG: hypothetical protein ACI8QG_001996, partial [Flavobacteriales bacterium]